MGTWGLAGGWGAGGAEILAYVKSKIIIQHTKHLEM